MYLDSNNLHGKAVLDGSGVKFYSEIGLEGVLILNDQERQSLINILNVKKNNAIKTNFLTIGLLFDSSNVTVSWPGDAGGEFATFNTQKLLNYLR